MDGGAGLLDMCGSWRRASVHDLAASSPPIGSLISILRRSASARNCGCRIRVSNDFCRIESGSAAMSGGPSTGRPSSCCRNTSDRMSSCSCVFAHVHHRRHVRQLRMRTDAKLKQQVELLVAQPVRAVGEDRRVMPVADPVHLAALHGERPSRRCQHSPPPP